MNNSKKSDPRFWELWRKSGAVGTKAHRVSGPRFNYRYNFNFTTHRDWDSNVSKEVFNSLVNKAANKVGGIHNPSFTSAVQGLGYPESVKRMVSRFVCRNNIK